MSSGICGLLLFFCGNRLDLIRGALGLPWGVPSGWRGGCASRKGGGGYLDI